MQPFRVFVVLGAFAALEPACSSRPSGSTASTHQGGTGTTTGSAGAEPTTTQGGGNQNQGNSCSGGACCPLPTQESACPGADEGQGCPTFIQCPGGLSLAAALTCTSGSWQILSEPCPALDGGLTAEGCPAQQPSPGAPCFTSDASGVCGYAVTCTPSCDAAPAAVQNANQGNTSTASGSACATVSEIAEAICTGGHWATEPLAPCPGPSEPTDAAAASVGPSVGGGGCPGKADAAACPALPSGFSDPGPYWVGCEFTNCSSATACTTCSCVDADGGANWECASNDGFQPETDAQPTPYCGLNSGPLDGGDLAEASPFEQCTPQYPTCTRPSPESPGWQCCLVSGVGGITEISCMPNDAGAYRGNFGVP
jgi:hypothetical protein